MRMAEWVKRELSTQHEADFELRLADKTVQHKLSRRAFESLSQGLISRLTQPIEQAMRDANLSPSE